MDISDEEIRRELQKQGYTDLSPTSFQAVKSDLQRLLFEEVYRRASFITSTPTAISSSSSHSNPDKGTNAHAAESLQCSRSCYSTPAGTGTKNEHSTTTCYSSALEQCSNATHQQSTLSSSSSTKFGERIMHRKVLRCRNGNAYISERSTLSTDRCYSSNSCEVAKESISLTEVQPRRLRAPSPRPRTSTNDAWHAVEKDLPPSRWTSIASLLQSSQTKVLWERGRHKGDPVARYHEYRRVWEKYKAPGEKSHAQLRWNVRAQMLRKDVVVTSSWRPRVEK